MKAIWLNLYDGLEMEVRQAREEGREIDAALEARVNETLALEPGDEKCARAQALFEEIQSLPCPANEPDELDAIRLLAEGNAPLAPLSDADIYDRVYGGWLGRAAGCLLGKPVEGWRTPELHYYLKATNNYPIHEYLRGDAPEDVRKKVCDALHGRNVFGPDSAFIENVDCMPEDDDTNYTIIGLKLLENYGLDFTSADVADCWLTNLPIYHLCTAERIAYRNVVMCKEPPLSATFCNGYREWIGAQIRADAFGYACPGNPRMAAEFAWRDARISHVKNGIYGEMWAAAMIAAGFSIDDPESVVRAGMREIPKQSRLYAGLEDALSWHAQGYDWDKAIARLTARWDEYNQHDWCHTISNAQIVALALVYGKRDFEKTLSMAVVPGFDTDCNGATAASVLGVMLGAKRLPEKWISPLNDELISGVQGFNRIKLSEAARRTVALIKKH